MKGEKTGEVNKTKGEKLFYIKIINTRTLLLIDALNHYGGKHNFLLMFATRCLYWQAYSTCTVHLLMRVYVCVHACFGCRAVKLFGQPSTHFFMVISWKKLNKIFRMTFLLVRNAYALRFLRISFYIYRQKRSSSTMSALFVQKPRTDYLNTGCYKGLLHSFCISCFNDRGA